MGFKLDTKDYIGFFDAVAKKIALEKEYITELDARTGDGDHWVNLNKGFSALNEKFGAWEKLSVSDLFKQTGMMLMSKVGGSSGALYGSAYLQASKAAAGLIEIDEAGLLIILEAQLDAIMAHGKAKPGFKTMIDPLYQAIEFYRRAIIENVPVQQALDSLVQGAETGMNATRDMEAVKGRASYMLDKGVGHLDPGAVTMFYQLQILADVCKKSIDI